MASVAPSAVARTWNRNRPVLTRYRWGEEQVRQGPAASPLRHSRHWKVAPGREAVKRKVRVRRGLRKRTVAGGAFVIVVRGGTATPETFAILFVPSSVVHSVPPGPVANWRGPDPAG